jgi:hypothetical protein
MASSCHSPYAPWRHHQVAILMGQIPMHEARMLDPDEEDKGSPIQWFPLEDATLPGEWNGMHIDPQCKLVASTAMFPR